MEKHNASYEKPIKPVYLFIGFGFLFLAFIALTSYLYQQFSLANRTLSEEISHQNIQSTAAMSMRVAVRERAILLWQMTLLDDVWARHELFEQFSDLGSSYMENHLTLLETDLTEQEKSLLSLLDQETTTRAPMLRKFSDLLLMDKGEDEYQALLNQALTDQVVVANLLDGIIQLQQKHIDIARDKNTETMRKQLIQLISLGSMIIIIGVVFARRVVMSSIRQNIKLSDANKKLEHLAKHDNLTGLANRLALLEYLNLGKAVAKRHNHICALLYIDLDGFKAINDEYGHEAGDKFLKLISLEMQSFRESDLVSRLGGDEFVILLYDIESKDNAYVVVDRLLKKLSASYDISVATVSVSASIGVCFFPYQDMNAEELLTCADKAMYEAKKSGKNRHATFN